MDEWREAQDHLARHKVRELGERLGYQLDHLDTEATVTLLAKMLDRIEALEPTTEVAEHLSEA